MTTPTANTAQFEFKVKNLDTELRVASLHGEESMSRLFQFELELVSEDPEIDFSSVVNQQAVITIEGQDETRHIHGIVHRFEQGDQGHRFTHYYAWLVPKLWWLGNRSDCRIFQGKDVKEIIEKVLKGAGLTQEDYSISVDGNYPKRDYCVQYRESDLAFIQRLMEEEGIYYYFKHDDQKHTLIIGDSSSSYGVIQDRIPFVSPTGALPDQEHVIKFRYTEGVSPGEVVLRDYNFKKPNTNLEVNESSDQHAELAVFEYPGNYEEPDRGKTVKQIRLEEHLVERKRATGTSNCPKLIPGYKFTLESHPRGSFNQSYLITTLVHDGKEPQALEEEAAGNESSRYSNNFTCIPADVVFRPGRKTPKPLMDGPQTAIVVGPKGEDIYTDNHARVRVQFHWDRVGNRDENSSCWVRVSQAWAGSGYGAMFIPRIGHEVVVEFLDGDPDRPIITGSVYHGTNRHLHNPTDNKTKSSISSSSGNEITLDDKKGQEALLVCAANDSVSTVGKNHSSNVAGSRVDAIEGDTVMGVKSGNIDIAALKGAVSIRTTSDESWVKTSTPVGDMLLPNVHPKEAGHIEIHAKHGLNLEADSDNIEIASKSGDISATANGKVEIEALTQDIELTATVGEIKMTAPKGVTVISPKGIETVTGAFFNDTGWHKQEAFGVTFGIVGAATDIVGGIAIDMKNVAIEHTNFKVGFGGITAGNEGIKLEEVQTKLKNHTMTVSQALLHLLI